MVNPNRFYTYAYLREDRTPYYIGKGSKNRAYTKNKREIKPPKDKSRIILLKQNLTEEEAFKHEKYMIAVFGRKDLGTGILHNKTDGGEGVSGIVMTEDIKVAKSEAGKKSKELGVGVHGRTKEKIIEDGRKGAEKQKEIGTGAVYGKSKEERIENGRTCGNKTKELGIGIHGLTPEQRVENAKNAGLVGGKRTRELGVGIFGRTKEQMTEDGKRGNKRARELGVGLYSISKEKRSETAKKINSQKWMCTETGFISTPGSLTNYQRNRGIDTSKRKRIE